MNIESDFPPSNSIPVSSEMIAGFYDGYTDSQEDKGTNLRHYHLFRRLIKAGLKRNHTLLEVGCGIGSLTGLVHGYLKQGKVVAADISEKSISIARKRLGNSSKVEFVVSDMQDFIYPGTFDFVVLADVLEHIPVEQHPKLFALLKRHMHDDSVIFINIPHPLIVRYFRKYHPDKLQIIDQEVHADLITRNAFTNGLILKSYVTYSLFNREADYVEIILTSLNELERISPCAKNHIIRRKFLLRIFYWLSIR
ncbi:MAG TPA: class I SAM-dependent methyltransferase [Bacteroidales bacterium]|nr:class I SAM-dependent methyltransferase [Bacteroidales bacterium]